MIIKIQVVFWFIRCWLKFLRGGKANKKINFVRKAVIIQNAKLGDMVCTTPMFRAIKDKYPDCKVFVIGNKINKELLDGNMDVDEYWVWGRMASLVKRLKEDKIDFGCVTSPNFEGLATLFLAGVPLIVAPKVENGWSPYETRTYHIIRKFCVEKPHRMGFYAPREYLKLLEPINIFSDDVTKHLGFSRSAKIKIDNLFKANKISSGNLIVGIAPGVGNKVKQWPIERFVRVADYIIEKYQAKVIIIGGKNDLRKNQWMFRNLKSKNGIINTTGRLSMDELKALISGLKLFISVDTGPIYIAEAFGIPSIDIVGPMDEKEQPPLGPTHRIVLPPDRIKPELHIMNARVYNRQEAIRQVKSITSARVIAEIGSLLWKLKTITR